MTEPLDPPLALPQPAIVTCSFPSPRPLVYRNISIPTPGPFPTILPLPRVPARGTHGCMDSSWPCCSRTAVAVETLGAPTTALSASTKSGDSEGCRGNKEDPSGMHWDKATRPNGHVRTRVPSGAPAPPWSSSCGAPGLSPAPAPSAGPCRDDGTGTGTWELHRTGTLPSPAARLSLPRTDTLRWLQPRTSVSGLEGPASHRCPWSCSHAVPCLSPVTAFTMAPALTAVSPACSSVPAAAQGSMAPEETTRPHAPPHPDRSHHVPLPICPHSQPGVPMPRCPSCCHARLGVPIQVPGVTVSPHPSVPIPRHVSHASQPSWTSWCLSHAQRIDPSPPHAPLLSQVSPACPAPRSRPSRHGDKDTALRGRQRLLQASVGLQDGVDPVAELGDAGVHAGRPGVAGAAAPGDDAHQVPGAVLLAHQRAPGVALHGAAGERRGGARGRRGQRGPGARTMQEEAPSAPAHTITSRMR